MQEVITINVQPGWKEGWDAHHLCRSWVTSSRGSQPQVLPLWPCIHTWQATLRMSSMMLISHDALRCTNMCHAVTHAHVTKDWEAARIAHVKGICRLGLE